MSGNDQQKVQSTCPTLITIKSSSSSSSPSAESFKASEIEVLTTPQARMKRPSSNGHHNHHQHPSHLRDSTLVSSLDEDALLRFDSDASGTSSYLDTKADIIEEELLQETVDEDSEEVMGPPSKRHKVGGGMDAGGPNHHMLGNDNGNHSDDEEGARLMNTPIEARFMVSSRDAGAIIGRGGTNITHLRQTYDASITVPDCPSPERVLTVVATIDKVANIVREVLKYIDTRPHALGTAPGRFEPVGSSGKNPRSPRSLLGMSGTSSSSSSFELKDKASAAEIRLLLHTSHAGGLIGKGGLRITQLREETQAGIKVYSECAPQSSERICVIYGPLEIVVQAVKTILYLITTFPMKGPNTLYDPRHFDQYLSPMYGGFSEAGPVLGSPGAGPPGGAGALVPAGGPPSNASLHSPGGSHHHQQRNPYFQPSPIPPPPPAPPQLNSLLARSRSLAGSAGSGTGRNSYPIPSVTSPTGGMGGAVGHYGNHQHHHHHQHQQSQMLSPLNGPRGGYKGAGLLEPDPQADLFAPDFGGTFTGADAAMAGMGNPISWSSARSYGSSRRSSSGSAAVQAAAAAAAANQAGLDLFASPTQEIDWLNYPGMDFDTLTQIYGTEAANMWYYQYCMLYGMSSTAAAVTTTSTTTTTTTSVQSSSTMLSINHAANSADAGGDVAVVTKVGAAAKSWNSGAALAAPAQMANSSMLHQLLVREDVSIVSNVDGTAIATINVPNKTVGAIIGRGGSRISEIRQKSHAEISIGQLNKTSSSNRVITVKGYLNEVQTACMLICKCIDDNP